MGTRGPPRAPGRSPFPSDLPGTEENKAAQSSGRRREPEHTPGHVVEIPRR